MRLLVAQIDLMFLASPRTTSRGLKAATRLVRFAKFSTRSSWQIVMALSERPSLLRNSAARHVEDATISDCAHS
jgi:hypothetical protein